MAVKSEIRIRRSATPNNPPTTTDLALGELAINTYDGKLFLKKDVSGTESIVEVGSTATPIPSGNDGQLQYNDGGVTNGTAQLYYDDVNDRVGIGTSTPSEALEVVGKVEAQEFIGPLRGAILFGAQAGEALVKGDVVYISGISGNTTIVSKADSDDAAKMPAFGVALAAANLNAAVEVVTFGTLSGINTSGFTVGDELYVSNTAGVLTNSAPTGESSALQKIAKVTRSDSNGSIKVTGAGRTNATPNLNTGRLFVGDANNQTVADDTIYVDIANSEVGINTTSPQNTLHVVGTILADHPDGNGASIRLGRADSSDYWDINHAGADFRLFNANGAGRDILLGVNPSGTVQGNKVGINTAVPNRSLHVAGAAQQQLLLENTDASGASRLLFKASSTRNSSSWIQSTVRGATADATDIQIGSANTLTAVFNEGSVGLGTLTPPRQLSIYNSGGAFIRLHREDGTIVGGNIIGQIEFSHDDTDNSGIGATISAVAEGSTGVTGLTFGTGTAGSSTEKMRIDTTGQVGIGTTDPLATMDVRGITWTYGSGDGNVVQKLGVLDSDANNSLYNIYTDDAGSSSPFGGDTLEFNTPRYGQTIGATRGSAAGGRVRSWQFVAISDGDERGIDFNIFTQPDSSATGSTATANTVKLSSVVGRDSYINSGNFGIGTTTPSEKLHVYHTGTATYDDIAQFDYYDTDDSTLRYQVKFGPNGGTRFQSYVTGANPDFKIIDQDNETGRLSFQVQSNAGAKELLAVDSGGNVGIGTASPASLLHVQDATADLLVRFESGDANVRLALIDATTTSEIKNNNGVLQLSADENNEANNSRIDFRLDGAEVARFRNDNLGIGTISPANKLHIESADEQLATFSSTDNRARIKISDDDTDVHVIAEGLRMSLGVNNSLTAGNVTIDSDGNLGVNAISPNTTIQAGSGTTDDAVRAYYNDASYAELRGYGVQFNRVINYLRPDTNGNKNLEIGGSTQVWNNVIQRADAGHVFTGSTVSIQGAGASYTGDGMLHINAGAGANGDAEVIIEADTNNLVETSNPLLSFYQDNRLVEARISLTGGNDDGATGALDNSLLIRARQTTNGHIQLATGGAASGETTPADPLVRMTIRNDGDVGIGTTAPNTKFHVNSTTGGTTARFENNGVSNVVIEAGTTNRASLVLRNGTGTSGGINSIDGGGVQIGFGANFGTNIGVEVDSTGNVTIPVKLRTDLIDSVATGGFINFDDDGGTGGFPNISHGNGSNTVSFGSVSGMNFLIDSNDNDSSQYRWFHGALTAPTEVMRLDGAGALSQLTSVSSTNISATTLTVEAGGSLQGPSTLYIDPAPDDTGEPGGATTDTGTVVILGDLQVNGTTTTINSTNTSIADLNITLADGAANAAAADGAGITIDGANATFTYDSTRDSFEVNKPFNGLNIDTNTNTDPFQISRNGSVASEVLDIGVTDNQAVFNYIEDTSNEGTGAYGSYLFQVSGNEGTSPTVGVMTLDETQLNIASNAAYRIGGSNVLNNSGTYIRLYDPDQAVRVYLGDSGDPTNYYDNTGHRFRLRDNSTNLGQWDSTGLGVGTVSAETDLHVSAAGVNGILLDADTSNTANSARLFFETASGTSGILGSGGNLSFRRGMTVNSTSGTETMSIDGSNSNVSMAGSLTVNGGTVKFNKWESNSTTTDYVQWNTDSLNFETEELRGSVLKAGRTTVNRVFFNNAIEDGGGVFDPGKLNVLAGANYRYTVAATNGGSSTTISDNIFEGSSSNQQFTVANTSTTEVVITISNISPQQQYTTFVGVTFGQTSYRAKDVKIETFRGNPGAWQTECDLTDQPACTVVRQVASNDNNGVTAVRYTFKNVANVANSYFRINNLFIADYNTSFAEGGYHVGRYHDNDIYSTSTFKDSNSLRFEDNSRIKVGTNDDLQIYHNGSDTVIGTIGAATGDLLLNAGGSGVLRINGTSTAEVMLKATENAGVELYHNGVQRLVTTVDGVSIVSAQNAAVTNLATSVSEAVLQINGDTGQGTDSIWAGKTQTAGRQYIQAANSAGNTAYDLLLNPHGGDVGIGTDNPLSKLDVRGRITIEENAVPLMFNQADQTNGTVGKWWRMPVDGTGLRFDVSLTGDSAFTTYRDVLTLNTSGDVVAKGDLQALGGIFRFGTNDYLNFDDDTQAITTGTNATTLTSTSDIAFQSNANDGGGGLFTFWSGSSGSGSQVAALNNSTKVFTVGGVVLDNNDDTVVTNHAALRRGSAGELYADAPGHIVMNIDSNNNNTDRYFGISTDANYTAPFFTVNEDGQIATTTENEAVALTLTRGSASTNQVSMRFIAGASDRHFGLGTDGKLYLATSSNISVNSVDAIVQAGRQINSGTGLTGGGNLTSNRTINIDYAGTDNFIDAATNLEGTAIATADTIVYHDASDNNVKKGLVSDLPFNNYSHPTQTAIDVNATNNGVSVIDRVEVNTLGHVTSVTTRDLSSATASTSGVVNAGVQTFGGAKTFNSQVTVDKLITASNAVTTEMDIEITDNGNIGATQGLNFYVDVDNSGTGNDFTWRSNARGTTGSTLLLTLDGDNGTITPTGPINTESAINITSTSATTPAITFNTNTGTDAGIEMAIRASGEGLDFYEPEDSDKLHMRIIDDTGVNAVFGLRTGPTNGTVRVDASGNLVSIGNITASGTITLSGLAGATESTSVMINGSNQLVTRELGSNAFDSTSYLPTAGGTMTGNITFTDDEEGIVWSRNTDGAGIKFYNTGDSDANSRLEYYTSDNGNEFHRFVHITSGTTYELATIKYNSGDGDLNVTGTINAETALRLNGTNVVTETRSVSAGNGLTGGGNLSANRTITLGTPSTLTGETTNGVTASSHTHEIANPTTGNWHNDGLPFVRDTDGVMEIGQHIDFHASDTGTSDYDVRLESSTAGTFIVRNLTSGVGLSLSTTTADFSRRVDMNQDLRIRGDGSSADLGVISIKTNASNDVILDAGNNGTNLVTIDTNGLLTATSKSFDIEHPTKEGKRLRYGSLEGPENGVYVRGRLKDSRVIELPDYWTGLVHEDSITVSLTAMGRYNEIWVEKIEDNKVYVDSTYPIDCFYHVFAERKDIDPLTVEYDA